MGRVVVTRIVRDAAILHAQCHSAIRSVTVRPPSRWTRGCDHSRLRQIIRSTPSDSPRMPGRGLAENGDFVTLTSAPERAPSFGQAPRCDFRPREEDVRRQSDSLRAARRRWHSSRRRGHPPSPCAPSIHRPMASPAAQMLGRFVANRSSTAIARPFMAQLKLGKAHPCVFGQRPLASKTRSQSLAVSVPAVSANTRRVSPTRSISADDRAGRISIPRRRATRASRFRDGSHGCARRIVGVISRTVTSGSAALS